MCWTNSGIFCLLLLLIFCSFDPDTFLLLLDLHTHTHTHTHTHKAGAHLQIQGFFFSFWMALKSFFIALVFLKADKPPQTCSWFQNSTQHLHCLQTSVFNWHTLCSAGHRRAGWICERDASQETCADHNYTMILCFAGFWPHLQCSDVHWI